MEPAAPPAGARSLLGPGLFVGVAVFAANGMNAIFQVASARVLDPEEYSLLLALVIVALIAAVPPLAFQALVAREVAVAVAEGDKAKAGAALRGTVLALVPWALGTLVLGGLACAVLAAAGRSDVAATLATAVTIAAALLIPAVWGGLLGVRFFVIFGLAQLLFAGTRLAAGLGIGAAGGDAGAVMAGVAAATVLTLGITLLPLRELWRAAGRGRARIATLPNAAAATGLTLLISLATVDYLVAKLAFSSSVAAAYGVASVTARVLLLLPHGVTTVLFPRVATLGDRARERRHLLAGLTVVAALGALATALLWVFAEPLVTNVFGEEYEQAVPWLGPLALAMALYAVTTVYVYHFLSLANTRFALVLVAIQLAQLVAFAVLHAEPADLIGVQIATAALTVAAAEAWYRKLNRSQAP